MSAHMRKPPIIGIRSFRMNQDSRISPGKIATVGAAFTAAGHSDFTKRETKGQN